MRAYLGDLDDVTAGDFEPFNAVNFGSYNAVHTDTGEIPSVAVDGVYAVVLDFRPQVGSITVTIDGVPATLGLWPVLPQSAGSASIDYLSGVLYFHSSDAGLDVEAKYKHHGSVLDAGTFNAMQVAVASGGGGGGAVDSVNGQTGTVVLDLDDFGSVIDDGDGDAYTYKLNEGQAVAVTRLDFHDGSGYIEHEAGPGYSMFRLGGGVTAIGGDGLIGAGTGITTLGSINTHSDVTITTAASGQVLQHDGTKWVNGRKISHGTTAPSSPAVGDIWLDTN